MYGAELETEATSCSSLVCRYVCGCITELGLSLPRVLLLLFGTTEEFFGRQHLPGGAAYKSVGCLCYEYVAR
jgi:hypothetical protein